MSEKRYKQLRIKEREVIEEGLNARKTISAIARETGISASTVSREIIRNRRDDGYRKRSTSQWGNGNLCIHRKGCKVTGLCKHCTSADAKSCGFCRKGKCQSACEKFEEEACMQITGSPHVCNGCSLAATCKLHRFRYSAKDAQAASDTRSREAREGIDVTAEDLEKSVSIIKAGIEKGQGIDHIFLAHGDELAFSKSSFYRHVSNGTVPILPIHLPKAVKYKPGNKAAGPTRTNIPAEVLAGRTYDDFMGLSEEERASVVECDCVEGPNDENDAVLTMHFKALHFQIAFKLEVKDSSHVIRCFEWLCAVLEDGFSKCFGILLFDRGSEFAGVLDIEALSAGNIKAFFTDARHPDQKGSAEKNHVEIRKVVKKGASLANIDMLVLSEVMSHVNSSLRHSVYGKCPMQLALSVLPMKLFEHLGYRLVPPDDVVLLPKLLESIRRPSK